MKQPKTANVKTKSYFDEIDLKSEKYKKAIEDAYKRFEEYKSEAQTSRDCGVKHTAILTLFNEIFQNFVEILLLRNDMTYEDYFAPKKKKNKKDRLSLQLEVFYNKQKDIEESFFAFNVQKQSKNRYPYFVYLDNLLRPYFEGAEEKAEIDEVKGGVKFSEQQIRLMSSLGKFLDSYYGFLDYDKISDEVLVKFIESEYLKHSKKLTLKNVKQAYIALRTDAHRFGEDNSETYEERKDFYEKSEFEQAEKDDFEDLEESYYESEQDEENVFLFLEKDDVEDDCDTTDDESFYCTENDLYAEKEEPFGDGFENLQLICLLEKCDIELEKEKKKFRKYISFQLTAHFLNSCVASLKVSDESYKSAVLRNVSIINAFIINIKKYHFVSEEVIKFFIIKKDKVHEKEIAEMLHVTEQTIRNHFEPFRNKVGLFINNKPIKHYEEKQ